MYKNGSVVDYRAKRGSHRARLGPEGYRDVCVCVYSYTWKLFLSFRVCECRWACTTVGVWTCGDQRTILDVSSCLLVCLRQGRVSAVFVAYSRLVG